MKVRGSMGPGSWIGIGCRAGPRPPLGWGTFGFNVLNTKGPKALTGGGSRAGRGGVTKEAGPEGGGRRGGGMVTRKIKGNLPIGGGREF